MSTTPMFAPDGTLGDIPNERVDEATKSGFKPGHELISPKGEMGVVPVDRVGDAMRAGFMPKSMASMPGNPSSQPMQAMPSSGTQALTIPAHGAGSLGPGQPEATPGMATAGAVGLSAAAGAQIPGALPWLAHGLKSAAAAVPTIMAMEGINYARKNLPGGKYIPAGAEWLPIFMGGKKITPAAEGEAASTATKIEGRAEGATAESMEVQNLPVQGVKTPAAQGKPSGLPEMQPSQSTTIAQHGYDPVKQQMTVQFKNGNVYRYSGVPQKVFDQYQSSESQGSFHANNIKGRYQTDKIGTVKPTQAQKISQALGGQQ